MLKTKALLFILLIAFVLTQFSVDVANGAKILFLLTVSSHSHRVALQALITALADRNHDVTVFSPTKAAEPNPKVEEFCTQALLDLNVKTCNDKSSATALRRAQDPHFDPLWDDKQLLEMFANFAENILRDPEFINWIANKTFDLVIYDAVGNEFMYPIAYHKNAKVIPFMTGASLLPYDQERWGVQGDTCAQDMVGNKYSWLPDRFSNIINLLDWHVAHRWNYLPRIEAVCREMLKFDFPPLDELLVEHTSLVLLNEHLTSGFTRAYPPFIIPIGGLHVTESSGILPKELENFIADVDQFVHISFGSVITVSKLPKELQQTLFDAVASFENTHFFWKWEGDLPENIPKNVLAKEWFPQQDILAHPKCKAFITQGGAMSQYEAIFHAVPVIVVPGFYDQALIAKAAVHHGYGIHLELSDITEETFGAAIQQILGNAKYLTAVKEVSRRFRDRPLSALETAVWWTEYVLRHDTSHLKSEALRQSWWQRRSLDFWLLVFLVLLIFVGISLLIITGTAIKLILKSSVPAKKVKQT